MLVYCFLTTATVHNIITYIRRPDKPNRLNKYTQSNASVLFPFPKTSFQFYRVRQPNARSMHIHIYTVYVSNNIFKYIIIVIHIIIMYVYIYYVLVCVCMYNTRFVNPISINVVLILLWDNLRRIPYSDSR
jgi:hypothetical protein